MTDNSAIPNNSVHGMVTFDLLINGSNADTSYQILSIAVMKEVNRIPTAHIVLRDGEASAGEFAISNTEDFVPGKKIEVKIGYDSQNETVFKGIIIKHHVRIHQNGNSELHVECRDETVKMTVGRHNHYYEDSTDSQVIEEIIGRYNGLQADVEATTIQHRELVQHHCSDWDFVLERAEANSRLVMVKDGVLEIKSPQTSGDPVLTLTYGATLIEFEAEMDARTQWKSVEAKAWDYANQSLFEHVSDTSSVTEAGNISGATLAEAINLEKLEFRHSGQVLETELQQWTESAMLKSRLAKIQGRAKCFGFSGVLPGNMILLQGVGDRFNGKLFVSAVRQVLREGNWETHIQFGLNPRWFHESDQIMDPPAGGLLPAVNGLQVGKVVQLQDDPDGEHRILVRLPVVDNSARGIWARVACLDAGQDRGTFFRPEVDDEVIVGFIQGDPRDAVVLGMFNSSAKPAPLTASDDNHEKGVFTRSKMRILFNDDTKTITIDTPAGNQIILDEKSTSIEIKDQNNNKMKMEPSGITMDSPANITIKAQGKIDIQATAALTIGGAQMTLSAQSAMEVKGAATKISGSGITEISGSLVKIN